MNELFLLQLCGLAELSIITMQALLCQLSIRPGDIPEKVGLEHEESERSKSL